MIKSTPHITIKMFNLIPCNRFSPSEDTGESRLIFWLRLVEDSGWGEGSAPPSGDIDHGEYIRYWHNASQPGSPLPKEVDEIDRWVDLGGPAIARSALDMALYDFIGRQKGQPLYRLLELPKPEPQHTCINLHEAAPEEMARQAKLAAAYPILKLRCVDDEDEKRLAAIRAARPDARIWVDAKGKWSTDAARRKIDLLEEHRVELVEQPLHPDDIESLKSLQKSTSIAIVADEGARSRSQIEELARTGIKGINLKLMKVGGVSPAVQMAKLASQLGLSVMLSSTFESSLATTAMAHLSSLAKWISLDTPLNIKNDPFTGIEYDENGLINISDKPGIGVRLKE